ncbi:hypothetical protein AgCh_040099 [Apium graveolens]
MDSQPSQSSGREGSQSTKSKTPQQIHPHPSLKLGSSNSLSKTLSDTQSLSTILISSQSNSDAMWTSWWSPSSVEFASINVSKVGPEISKSRFEAYLLSEKLAQYLDIFELHLVKEISLRSNSFFEAQEHLEGLNVRIVEGCSGIIELKETIRILDSDLVDSARQIQEHKSYSVDCEL